MKAFLLGFLSIVSVLMSDAQSRYNFSKLSMEKLGRGVVAVRENPENVVISWRYLTSDPENQSFNIFRNGKKINSKPIKGATFYSDNYKDQDSAVYTVKPLSGDLEGTYVLPANSPYGYINIPLNTPEPGVDVFGDTYFYNANDASVGDVDGDGEYEIFLKWDPSNSKDNSHSGLTASTLIDCYKLDGSHLWRIDLGKNIRSGAHYTQMMVYDLDGDGSSEIVVKTADGSIDGSGKILGDKKADFRSIDGRILAGPEYLTIFNGRTGEALQTIDYYPSRGNLKEWGDGYANRADRFLAAIAYLDGEKPSVVMCRGYYTRSVLVAYQWDGIELKEQWVFDSNTPGNELYAGQGNHNLRVADVDGDGFDEIIYGQMVVDHDGAGLYSTGMGHGDAMHLISDINNEKYYIVGCHENGKDGTTLREASTGKIIHQFKSDKDIGRCMAADIDPTHPGVEWWSPNTGGVISFDGETVVEWDEMFKSNERSLPANFSVQWDGDLSAEILDENIIMKYDWVNKTVVPIMKFEECMWNNGSKRNPSLQGDIIGDWREEVVMRTADNSALRIYVSPIPTENRFHTFMEDPVYRVSVANQNVAYNQPAEPGFYFGSDLKGKKFRGTKVK